MLCGASGASLYVVLATIVLARGRHHDSKALYDHLLMKYNKNVRPVRNSSDVVVVKMKLRLSQLIDVNLKNQIMTTNVWVEQYWYDENLRWNPNKYSGVTKVYIPSEQIWRPDIVLYNNAGGNFEVTLSTKATVHNTGLIEWKPPAIYASYCEINVEYFPYDEQTCLMKFGSWTYDGLKVDLRHLEEVAASDRISMAIDLSEFYNSIEWEILSVPAQRRQKLYTCCKEPYFDITFNITMRRKTLFYTVNLIIPCMAISFLTILTFYLPSDSREKVTLSISILVSLHVFFLLVAEIVPPSSTAVPLLGKYLIFAMVLDTLSICVTVIVLNVHFRSPRTHTLSPWMRSLFIHLLPRFLLMKRRSVGEPGRFPGAGADGGICFPEGTKRTNCSSCSVCSHHEHRGTFLRLQFMAARAKLHEDEAKIKEDWKYIALVLDRLFLWTFFMAVLVGTVVIILQAPSLHGEASEGRDLARAQI